MRGWIALLVAAAAAVVAEQQPFELKDAGREYSVDAPLSGRFLHVTDMHMDKHYKDDTAVVSSCHHNKPHNKHGGKWRAGHYGTPVSDCDSPRTLGNKTLEWVTRNWNVTSHDDESAGARNPFDFVLWTGDSARHEQDPLVPRTAKEVLQANEFAVELMESYFPTTPIVPNFGNNDVALHNIMPRGPSKELEAFLSVWKNHIPGDQHEAFREGGYFAKDIVPDRLGVISINTLYFYDSNKAVDGCPKRRRRDRRRDADIGTLQLEWMTERLLEFRRRNMQVHIIGHVPPTAGNYFVRCFDVYTELVLRFQDTIVGQHFGHMNLDMFFIQESALATARTRDVQPETVPVVMKRVEEDLRHDYESLPGPARTNMDYYSTFFVSPSVVPTYLPAVRVWTYNTSLVHDNRPGLASVDDADREALLDFVRYDSCAEDDEDPECHEEVVAAQNATVQKKQRNHSRPHRRSRRRHHKMPRYASPDAPSRSNTYLSLLGYSEWVLDLPKANKLYEKTQRVNGTAAAEDLLLEFDLEYATYNAETLWHEYFDLASDARPQHSHHSSPWEHHIPVPRHLLERKLKQLHIDTPLRCRNDKCRVRHKVRFLSEYGLSDMTLRSVMNLARQLVLDRKLWKHYVHRMYTNSLLNE